MLYKFTYFYNGRNMVHLCSTIREADVFFEILLALKCEYIKVITFTKQNVNK